MRHLIVEACIARNLIDTSAYYWPGYVSASVIALNEFSPVQKSPWSMFMEGALLNGSLVNLLFSTPASRCDKYFLFNSSINSFKKKSSISRFFY